MRQMKNDVPEKTIMTFRVEKALREAFDVAARGNDRTGSQLLRDFMRDYVKRNAQGDLLKMKA
jgi:predicted transcriptional regulator